MVGGSRCCRAYHGGVPPRAPAWLVLLALTSCAEPAPAEAQPASFDPRLASPRIAGACEVLASGGLQHATPVGPDALAVAHALEPRGPEGYDSDSRLLTLKVLERPSLAPRWRRVIGGPIYAVAASPDGTRVAVGTAQATLLFDARDGRELARIDGASWALAFGPSGALARATEGRVTLHDGPALAQVAEHAITGSAPTVIHAMMTDGTCEERQAESPARVTALALGEGGAVYAGVSDGSVRALGTSRRFDLPGARPQRGYATPPILLAARGRALVSVWGDGSVVTLDARTLARRRVVPGECSAAERARVGPDCDGSALVAALEGDRVATPGRVRTLDGRAVASMPTLHGQSVAVASDELWLFGIGGTAERWSLAGGGRFLGYLPIPGRTGWVRDVSHDGRYVAIVTPAEPAPRPQLDRRERYSVRVLDTRTERELAALRRTGLSARFLTGGLVALQTLRAIEIVEVATGRRVRAVPLASYEYAGIVEAAGDRLVLAETSGRARVVDARSGAIVEIDFGAGTVTRARLDGDRLALLVLEAPPRFSGQPGGHRVEVFSLAGRGGARIRRVDGVGQDALELSGSELVFVRDGAATRLDLSSGREAPLPGAPERTRSVARIGHDWLLSPQGAGPMLRAGRPFGPPALHIVRVQPLAHATLLYELGGAVYVVDATGTTRGSIDSVDGGFVVSSAAGHFSASQEARGALAARHGPMLRACDPSAGRAGLLEALLAR